MPSAQRVRTKPSRTNTFKGYTLIVTEKAKASLKVAETYPDLLTRTVLKNAVHISGNTLITNVSGHIAKRSYGDAFKSWARINYDALIVAEPEVHVDQYYRRFFTKLLELYPVVKLVIMSDDDQEGELLGHDVANLVVQLSPAVLVTRWRTSALDVAAINKAKVDTEFDERVVASTELRHILDLKWGVTLTVAFTNTGRGHSYGASILSIGRVQTAVLGLMTAREQAIRAFKKTTFFVRELQTDLGLFTSVQRFQNLKQLAESVNLETVYDKACSEVTIVAPSPLNVTDLMKLGHRLRMDAGMTMLIAESLYLKGLITYPRTDSREVDAAIFEATVKKLIKNKEWLMAENLTQESALTLLAGLKLRNKKGDKTHPPILPTGETTVNLSGKQVNLLNSIVRHTFKMLKGDGRVRRHKLQITLDGVKYVNTVDDVLEQGHMDKAPSSVEFPSLVTICGIRVRKSETKAPSRYNAASLIKEMEVLKIGTKSTRHLYAGILQSRSYVKKYTPMERGLKLARLLREQFPMLVTSELTAKIEDQLGAYPEKGTFLKPYQQLLSKVVTSLKTPAIMNQVRGIYRLK